MCRGSEFGVAVFAAHDHHLAARQGDRGVVHPPEIHRCDRSHDPSTYFPVVALGLSSNQELEGEPTPPWRITVPFESSIMLPVWLPVTGSRDVSLVHVPVAMRPSSCSTTGRRERA